MKPIKLTKEVIEGFVNSCLRKKFDGSLETPEFHRELWDIFCSNEKYVAIAAPRAHAKSTAGTISFSLASVLFRNKKYVLIVSDTERQASMFLNQIKQELSENEDIIDLFGILRDERTGKVKFIKDTETDFIMSFTDGQVFRIVAKGAEQSLRGLLWDHRRPDLIFIDDLENDEMVMNRDRREKLRDWFYGALMPLLSSSGEIRYVGTILHLDALLERFMPPSGHKLTVVEGVKTYSTDRFRRATGGWKGIKYRAHTEDFKEILWPAKHTKETLTAIREMYIAQGKGELYSQEFLNIPLDESNTYFKKTDFVARTEQDKKKKLNYYVSADLAISQRERADYSAFIVGGIDENGVLHIEHVIRERLDGREIVNTILTLQRIYKPFVFGIEEMQVSKAIGPFLREEMLRNNNFVNLVPLKPHKSDKLARARSIQARMRAQAVKFDKQAEWYPDLESELLQFPRGRHDDLVDAMAYLGYLIDYYVEAPTKEEEEEELYGKEFGPIYKGRNTITGY